MSEDLYIPEDLKFSESLHTLLFCCNELKISIGEITLKMDEWLNLDIVEKLIFDINGTKYSFKKEEE